MRKMRKAQLLTTNNMLHNKSSRRCLRATNNWNAKCARAAIALPTTVKCTLSSSNKNNNKYTMHAVACCFCCVYYIV